MDFICKLEFDFTSLLIEAVIGSLLAVVILAGTIFFFVKRNRARNQDTLVGVEAVQLSQAELKVLASYMATGSFENMQQTWRHDIN
jgi:ribosome-associated toxin RatA of RatAB toxin-antitoxin module